MDYFDEKSTFVGFLFIIEKIDRSNFQEILLAFPKKKYTALKISLEYFIQKI